MSTPHYGAIRDHVAMYGAAATLRLVATAGMDIATLLANSNGDAPAELAEMHKVHAGEIFAFSALLATPDDFKIRRGFSSPPTTPGAEQADSPAPQGHHSLSTPVTATDSDTTAGAQRPAPSSGCHYVFAGGARCGYSPNASLHNGLGSHQFVPPPAAGCGCNGDCAYEAVQP